MKKQFENKNHFDNRKQLQLADMFGLLFLLMELHTAIGLLESARKELKKEKTAETWYWATEFSKQVKKINDELKSDYYTHAFFVLLNMIEAAKHDTQVLILSKTLLAETSIWQEIGIRSEALRKKHKAMNDALNRLYDLDNELSEAV